MPERIASCVPNRIGGRDSLNPLELQILAVRTERQAQRDRIGVEVKNLTVPGDFLNSQN